MLTASKVINPATPEDLQVVADYLRKVAPPGTFSGTPAYVDPVDFIHRVFYIPETQRLLVLRPHQQTITRLMVDPANDFVTMVYSTGKKGGKSAWAAATSRYFAENSGYRAEVNLVGHDLEQGRARSYQSILNSIELTPGFDKSKNSLPGKWKIIERHAVHLPTNSIVKALSNDYQGEAGGNPVCSTWTELWAHKNEKSKRLWVELTPVPTRARSVRIVETYAGYEDESELLLSLYKLGLDGHRMTHEELLPWGGWPFEDQPPIWINKDARLVMYWDHGEVCQRRMPWQTPAYYAEQAKILPPNEFRRLHLNEWISSVSEFISEAQWLKCKESLPPLRPRADGDKTPCVLGVDASVTNDCTALVLCSRHPSPDRRLNDVAIRKSIAYYPKLMGGHIDLDVVEGQIREWCATYNVVQMVYDAYQLHQMSGRLVKDAVVWCKPFGQMGPRAIADKQLYDLIMNLRIAHDGNPELLKHVKNAATKATAMENEKMRIIKRSNDAPVDLTVATSMAAFEVLRLNLV